MHYPIPSLKYPHALVTCYLHYSIEVFTSLQKLDFFFLSDTHNFLLLSKFSKKDVRIYVHSGQKNTTSKWYNKINWNMDLTKKYSVTSSMARSPPQTKSIIKEN